MDAVITWVDGSDPKFRQLKARYSGRNTEDEAVGGTTRYYSSGEIYRCVASINRFAPFIRKIFIVTKGQDPQLDPFLKRNFPEGYIPYEIVDEKVITKGYEEYAPLFNSIALEALLWRIPGLSEQYLGFCDDFILTAPCRSEDFFPAEGVSWCYGVRRSIPLTRFKLRKDLAAGKMTYKGPMLNGAAIAGEKWTYVKYDHVPRPLFKSFYARFFSEHPEALIRNISHRFRNPGQFNSEEVQYLTLLREGCCRLHHLREFLFIQPRPAEPDYIPRKLRILTGRKKIKFLCINSIELAPGDQAKDVFKAIDAILNIEV